MTFSTVMRHFARALPRARKKGVQPEPWFRNTSNKPQNSCPKTFCRSGERVGKQVLGRFGGTLQGFFSVERVILAEAIWRTIKPLPLYTLSDSSLVVSQMPQPCL